MTMNPDERAAWIARLDAIRTRAAANLEAWKTEQAEDDMPEVHDLKEQSETIERGQLRAEQIRVEQTILDATLAARLRIDDRTFGICIDCGESISRDRLLAMPTALRCMACQRAFDTRRG